jgi:arsenate reductase (thioredoxin)
MAEGWFCFLAKERGLELEVYSAGTEKSKVKADAILVMNEVGIDLSAYTSKTLHEVPDPWNFDVVITVCDSANEICPAYPAKTTRLHRSFPDPSGQSLGRWREVRDALRVMAEKVVADLAQNRTSTEGALRPQDLTSEAR